MTRRELEALLATASAPHRDRFRLAILSAVVASAAGVLLLGLSGWFITGAALAGAAGAVAVQAFNYLLPSAGIRVLAIVRTLGRYGERLWAHEAALRALAELRVQIFARIASASDVRSVSAGEAVAHLVEDIGALEDRLVRAPAFPAAMAAAVSGVALALLAGPLAAVGLILLLLALPLGARAAAPRLLSQLAVSIAEGEGALRARLLDHALASSELVAFGLVSTVGDGLRVDAQAVDLKRVSYAGREAAIIGALTLAAGLGMATTLALADAPAPLVVLAVLTAGGALEAYAAYIRGVVREAAVSAGMSRLEGIGSAVRAPSGLPLTGARLDFANVARVSHGGRLAIVGPSGAGKTTLLEELAGLRPSVGRADVRIDGQPICELEPEALRALCALSPQDAPVLTGVIRDNLRLARPGLEDADLWAALEAACLADEIRAAPGGLDRWVGDGGAQLSGGQRKRLSLARALLAGRPWLLLDEPTEGLDRETEARVVRALDQWLGATGRGLIVVSHRPALVAMADTILDLGDGAVRQALAGAALPKS